MRRGLLLMLALFSSALPLEAQSTRPAPGDSYSGIAITTSKKGSPTTQSTATATSGGNSLDTTRVVIALGVVLVAIIVISRMWKKFGLPGAQKSSGSLQIVSRLNITPKQQVLLIRVGRRAVLVGNSGARMDRLCEISDTEEVAALLGQTASEREGSVTSSFDEVLGGAETEYTQAASSSPQTATPSPTAEQAQCEIQDMMEKVRNLSRQFRRGEA